MDVVGDDRYQIDFSGMSPSAENNAVIVVPAIVGC